MAEPWEERADRLDARLDRLAALIAPLTETVNRHDMLLSALASEHLEHAERLANHDAIITRLDATIVRLDASIERLDRLIARVFRDDLHNGDTA